ncbi:ricin B lectin domain-containing protein [Crepidotus variabilis]|uniref:Ricin B lectin domain-containing protein n=1 Tax=Crepidotus variabilis TaxID=179855 RepID=A0A9P6E9I1_9AGAR|nr:ricin B lectin domain-containing protein [Crepidotus variabilis]
MLARLSIALALAATGLAQVVVPAGYRTATISTAWNDKFVLQPQAPIKSGSAVVLYSVNNHIEQQWYLKDGSTKVQLANTTLCLDAGSNHNNGNPLTVTTCSDTLASQKWQYNTDSQIVLDQTGTKLCADLYMGTLQNNTRIVIWNCIAGDKNHIWKTTNVTVPVVPPVTTPPPP